MAFAPFGTNGVALKSDLSEISSGIPDSVKEALKGEADKIAEAAKAKAPVDTGRLRDSIHVIDYNEPGFVGYRVVADAGAKQLRASRWDRKNKQRVYTGGLREAFSYAFLVEYGSVHNQPPRPFLVPALREKSDETVKSVEEALGEL